MVHASDVRNQSAFAPCAATVPFSESQSGDVTVRVGSQSRRTQVALVRCQPSVLSFVADTPLTSPTVMVAAPAARLLVQPAARARAQPSFGAPGTASGQVAIAWLQDAPRVDDNPALHEAVARGGPVVPIIVDNGNEIVAGSVRAYAISGIASVHATVIADLQASLHSRGSDLVVLPRQNSDAETAALVLDFCSEVRADTIYMLAARTDRHRAVQAQFSRLCRENGMNPVTLWTGSLVGPEQLPFTMHDIPDDCDQFGDVLQKLEIPRPLPAPDHIPCLPGTMQREPSQNHDLKSFENCEVGGGETAGLKLMEAYIAGHSLLMPLKHQQAMSRYIMSEDFDGTTVPTPRIATALDSLQQFLDIGCISPRRLYHELARRFGEHSPRRFCAELTLFLREHRFYVCLKSGSTNAQLRCS